MGIGCPLRGWPRGGELRSRAGGLALRGRKVPVGDQQPVLQARWRARGCWKERHVGGGHPESWASDPTFLCLSVYICNRGLLCVLNFMSITIILEELAFPEHLHVPRAKHT